LLKLYKEFFLLKTFLPKYIRKPRYMEVKIHARIRLSPPIVKFVLGWPKLADFVAIGPKSFFFKKKNLSETCTAVYTCIGGFALDGWPV
jgi:hypothetical protein